MPPRHSKSELISRRLPALALGRNPDERIMGCAYSEPFSQEFNRDIQGIITGDEYRDLFPDTRLSQRRTGFTERPYQRNASVFEIVDCRGYYRASGIGGSITGKGATLAIIDDPIKNHEEAYSATHRKSIQHWYTSTLRTRMERDLEEGSTPPRIIVVATRWHEDDLIGWLQATDDRNEWHALNLPAILDSEPHPCDPREQGDALWPVGFNIGELRSLESDVGPRDWESLYQGRPSPAGGGMVKTTWWQRYGSIPGLQDKILTVDPNFGEKTKEGSRCAMYVMGIRGPDRYIMDARVGRMDFTEMLDAIRHLVSIHPDITTILIEKKAAGAPAINVLRREFPGVTEFNPTGSKEARVAAITHYFSGGNIFVPDQVNWVGELIHEFAAFPAGRYDDRVDAISQALIHTQDSFANNFAALAR
ncbi:MAG: phage terminase large subunit [bacterium]|nr:phage terminase large subunit [bacterium]